MKPHQHKGREGKGREGKGREGKGREGKGLSGNPMLGKLEVFLSFSWPTLISRASGDDMMNSVPICTAQSDVMRLHVILLCHG